MNTIPGRGQRHTNLIRKQSMTWQQLQLSSCSVPAFANVSNVVGENSWPRFSPAEWKHRYKHLQVLQIIGNSSGDAGEAGFHRSSKCRIIFTFLFYSTDLKTLQNMWQISWVDGRT